MTTATATAPRGVADHAAIARHYGVAVGTVRYWASVDQWVSQGRDGRRRLWSLADARASWAKRHAADLTPA